MHNRLGWVKGGIIVLFCCCFILPVFALYHNNSEEIKNHDSILGVVNKITDEPTTETYQEILGLPSDGGRYAGRVWTDKSVLTNGLSEEMGNHQTITVKTRLFRSC